MYYNNNLIEESITKLFSAKTTCTNENNNIIRNSLKKDEVIPNIIEEDQDEFFSNDFKVFTITKGFCDICSIDLSNKIGFIDTQKFLKVCLDHFASFNEFIKKNIKVHKHQLKGLKKNNYDCSICKKNYSQLFAMNCMKCDFIICFNCYISNKKSKISGIYISHFHDIYVKIVEGNKIYNCDNCNNIIKIKYRCCTCKFNLCEICVQKLLNSQNYKHNHNSILSKKSINCLECRKKKDLFMSCYQIDCKYEDICLDCYINDSIQIFSSINDFFLENIHRGEVIVSSHFILPHLHKAFYNDSGTINDIRCSHCNKIDNISFYCPECCLCLCKDITDIIPIFNSEKDVCRHDMFLDKKNQLNNYRCYYDKFPQKNNHLDIFMVCNKCNINICLNCLKIKK